MRRIVAGGIVALGVLAVTVVVVVQGQAGPQAGLFPYQDRDAVARGAVLYGDYCASCHGTNLEGQAHWRVPNADGHLPAPPHDQTNHTWHHPDAQLFQIVKYGTAALVGGNYQSDMAGYEDVLSDDQIREVMAYIKSTWPSPIIARHDEMNARLEVSE